MKIWKDKQDLINVKWIRMPDDTPIFPLPHVFGSLHTWDRNAEPAASDCGEKGYFGYYNSENPLGYTGLRHCGSDTAMSEGGVTGRDPPILTEADGWSPCCGTPRPICGVVIPPAWRLVWESPAGCTCAGAYDVVLQAWQVGSGPGDVWEWRYAPPDTYPLPWGAACIGGADFWRLNFFVRFTTSSCDCMIVPEWELGGLIHFTRTAHPKLVIDWTGRYFLADTLDPTTWPDNSPGQTIWEVGECKIVIGDPAHRWVFRMYPLYPP